jgi:hypothetical protein
MESSTSTQSTPAPPPKIEKSALTKRKYIDYDLSQMKDSKGGFLLTQDTAVPDSARSNKLRPASEVNVTYLHTLHPPIDPSNPSHNVSCQDCGSLSLDTELLTHFKVHLLISVRLLHMYTFHIIFTCRIFKWLHYEYLYV